MMLLSSAAGRWKTSCRAGSRVSIALGSQALKQARQGDTSLFGKHLPEACPTSRAWEQAGTGLPQKLEVRHKGNARDAGECAPCEAVAHEGGHKAHDDSKEAEPDAWAGGGTLQRSQHPEDGSQYRMLQSQRLQWNRIFDAGLIDVLRATSLNSSMVVVCQSMH